MSDQIKLFKQLISVTTDKESKKQLQNMLNQTMKDIKPKSKSKFSIYKQPASKIKDLGFKTKKQFTEFSKTNQFQTKGFNSEAEFNKYYKNKLYQYNVINDIMTDKKNYTKKQVENEKLYNEMVTPAKKYTTMCLLYMYHFQKDPKIRARCEWQNIVKPTPKTECFHITVQYTNRLVRKD